MHAKHFLSLWLTTIGVAAFPQQRYQTEKFTAPNMAIESSGQDVNEGDFLFTANGSPLIMTPDNELIWHGDNVNAENLKLSHYNEERVMGYWSGYQDNFGHGYGQVNILDATYSLIKEFCLPSTELFVTPDPSVYPGAKTLPCYIDRHESFITRSGTILVSAVNVTNYDLTPFGGPENGWVFDNLIYEIDIATDVVLFRWSALENVDPKNSHFISPSGDLTINGVTYGNDQSSPWDWFQLDSIQPYNDTGNYIVSSRALWTVHKISSAGDVIWTLEGSKGGDFSLGDGVSFSWQHFARAHKPDGDMKLKLFDNGNYPGLASGTNSRGLWMRVDEDNKSVSLIQEYIDRSEPIASLTDGNYQHLPHTGNILLYYGDQAVIKEFNKTGGVIYTAKFGDVTSEDSNTGTHSYRAYKQANWSATPYTEPKFKAVYSGSGLDSGVDVYASWNGATSDVFDSWNIYGGVGTVLSQLKLLHTVKRKGFETHVHIGLLGVAGQVTTMSVEAVLGGKVVKSSIVSAILGS